MDKIRYRLVYNRKKQIRKDGTAVLQIECYQNGKRTYFDTKIYVEPIYWDEKNKRIKGIHPNSIEYNFNIKEQLKELENFEFSQKFKKKSVDLNSINDFKKGNIFTSFTEYFYNFIKTDNTLKPITLKKYKDTYGKLCRFKKNILFEELNYTLIKSFDNNLRTLGITNNSIYAHHKNVKKLLNQAVKNDLIDINPYSKFKTKWDKTDKTPLTLLELELFESFVPPIENIHLERIKDMFLLSCYTGLRYSDISKLNYNSIVFNKEGYNIYIKSQKNEKPINLPLYHLFKNKTGKSKPELIIDKYMDTLIETPFKITNQYYNRSLNEISQILGINKKITSHTARHTFGTLMASKVKTSTLKELLQHSSYITTDIYVHMSNEMINEDLKKINW